MAGPADDTLSTVGVLPTFWLRCCAPHTYTMHERICCLFVFVVVVVFKTKRLRKLLRISYQEHKTNDWVRSKINFHRNLFWQLSRDGKLHGSGMSNATTASLKPSFRAPWWVGGAVVGRGNAGWTTSKSGHHCTYQN